MRGASQHVTTSNSICSCTPYRHAQVSAHPWEIHWNLMDNRMWRPFFGQQVIGEAAAQVQQRCLASPLHLRPLLLTACHAHSRSFPTHPPQPLPPTHPQTRTRTTPPSVQLPPRLLGTVQTPVVYEEREELFYEQLETRCEEAVRDALQSEWCAGLYIMLSS